MEEITIDISSDGEDVKVEGKNIQGPHCVQLTAEIERALGAVQKVTRKPEFHRKATLGRKTRA